MGPYSVDMAGPDPTHEAAYARVLRVVRGHKAFIDAMVKARPADLAKNWKLALVRKDPEIGALRGLWQRDEEFRSYLRSKLAGHLGRDYTESLIRVFLT